MWKQKNPQPLNTSSWQRNTPTTYGSRAERNTEQNTSGNIDRNHRPMENRSWRSNPQSTYQIRNMDIGAEAPQKLVEEEDVPSTKSGNEPHLRL